MPRRINKKCLHCATLPIEEAMELHGETGDNCWNPKICHRRRSHYRHREDINGIRRRLRKVSPAMVTAGTIIADPEEYIELAPPPPPIALAAVLVLYRQHSEAPVHAVTAEVWRGDQKIAGMKPVHCMGMRGDRVTAYIKELLVSLNQQFGVSRFEDVVKELPVEACPIENCPLKG